MEETPSTPLTDSPWGSVTACDCGRVAPEGLPVPHAESCPQATERNEEPGGFGINDRI